MADKIYIQNDNEKIELTGIALADFLNVQEEIKNAELAKQALARFTCRTSNKLPSLRRRSTGGRKLRKSNRRTTGLSVCLVDWQGSQKRHRTKDREASRRSDS